MTNNKNKNYYDREQNFFTEKLETMTDIVMAMDTIVRGLNDETAYFENWIDIVPADAGYFDFEDIANDKEMLSDVVERFKYIIEKFID